MNIPKIIKEILKESKWSQDELAHRLNVSNKALSFWVTGKAEPRAKNLEEINKYYQDIVGRTEISPEDLANIEKQALATHIDLDELLENQELLKTTTLYLTYHTNTIEGSTMTIEEVAKVLNDENTIIPDKTVREQMEARNHRTAFLFLLSELKKQGKSFRWTPELIKDIHLRLMNGVLESAGQYRNYGVRVMGSRAPRTNSITISREINKLVEYMNIPQKDLIAQLAKTHATFERIHPFGDGNGRTGRLIMFAQALQGGIVPPLVIKERKHAYYKYLEMAHLEDRYDLLELFIAESVLFTDELLSK